MANRDEQRLCWLATKLTLIVVYGVLATSRRGAHAATRKARVGFYVAALLPFAFVISIAIAHHPLGIFFRWFG